MSKKNSKKNIQKRNLNSLRDTLNWYFLSPILFIVGFIPLIVRLSIVELGKDTTRYWIGIPQNFDFFSYNKMIWLLGAAILLTILVCYLIIKGKLYIKKIYINYLICTFSLFSIISFLFSDVKSISLFGYPDRFEGIFVLLTYMIILFTVVNLIKNEKMALLVIKVFIYSSLFIGIIGILQFLGNDIFKTEFMKAFIIPSKYSSLVNELFTNENNSIYATLFHYNYVGSYMAMAFPLVFTLFIHDKNKKSKIFLGMVSFVLFFNLIACKSRAGFVGGTFAIVMLIIMARKQIINKWKYVVLIISVSIVMFVGVNIATSGLIFNRIKSIVLDPGMAVQEYVFKDISGNKDEVTLTLYDNRILKLSSKNSLINIKDEKDKNINIIPGNEKLMLDDERYSDVSLGLGNLNGMMTLDLNVANNNLKMVLESDGIKFLNTTGETFELKPIESLGFKEKEKWGSSRGYIWSRTLPLLKYTIIKGYGPDAFAAYFPQDDVEGKLLSYGTNSILVDKPHNYYLQTAVNTGVISLISILLIFLIYFVGCLKLYFNGKFEDSKSIIGLAVFVAFCGYATAAFFNDSVVSVAPVFWVLLGIGISINYTLKSEENKF